MPSQVEGAKAIFCPPRLCRRSPSGLFQYFSMTASMSGGALSGLATNIIGPAYSTTLPSRSVARILNGNAFPPTIGKNASSRAGLAGSSCGSISAVVVVRIETLENGMTRSRRLGCGFGTGPAYSRPSR